MKLDVCKLCGAKTKLQKSHTVSKFLLQPTYDSKGTSLHYRTQGKLEIFYQDGPKEHLLCRQCEQHLGKIESQFKNEWYCRLPTQLDKDAWILRGFDYTIFKLFHLSILWRCSVSKLELHRDVQLGFHEKRIAQLLLEMDAGEDREYLIAGQLLTSEDGIAHGFIVPPVLRKLEGLDVYMMAYGGCEWILCISRHPNATLREYGLRRNGTLVLVREELQDSGFAKRYRAELQTERGREFSRKYKRLK